MLLDRLSNDRALAKAFLSPMNRSKERTCLSIRCGLSGWWGATCCGSNRHIISARIDIPQSVLTFTGNDRCSHRDVPVPQGYKVGSLNSTILPLLIGSKSMPPFPKMTGSMR
jgi:hypothetical protein